MSKVVDAKGYPMQKEFSLTTERVEDKPIWGETISLRGELPAILVLNAEEENFTHGQFSLLADIITFILSAAFIKRTRKCRYADVWKCYLLFFSKYYVEFLSIFRSTYRPADYHCTNKEK